jgi:hypothetical protein
LTAAATSKWIRSVIVVGFMSRQFCYFGVLFCFRVVDCERSFYGLTLDSYEGQLYVRSGSRRREKTAQDGLMRINGDENLLYPLFWGERKRIFNVGDENGFCPPY